LQTWFAKARLDGASPIVVIVTSSKCDMTDVGHRLSEMIQKQNEKFANTP